MIEVRNLVETFGARLAVDDVTFRVEPGRVTAFLGPNGSGKTTTMRILLGLETATSGSATIDGISYAMSAAERWRLLSWGFSEWRAPR